MQGAKKEVILVNEEGYQQTLDKYVLVSLQDTEDTTEANYMISGVNQIELCSAIVALMIKVEEVYGEAGLDMILKMMGGVTGVEEDSL